MENNEYDTLTQRLIRSGILQNDEEDKKDVNFFNAKSLDEVTETATPEQNKDISRKRLNNYDLELLEKTDSKIASDNENNFKKLLYKFFPKLYEFKVAKDAIQKMTELGIDTDYLLNKTVPYGEGELRYKKLVKFIKYANEIQTKLKRKTKD